MKKLLLVSVCLMVVGCASEEQKSPMFFGAVGPMEWPEEHWEGQNYHPLIRDYQNALPAAQKRENSMFNNVSGLSPKDFVQSLKQADIVNRVYNEQSGTIEQKDTGKVIIELGSNFYALSKTDQDVIAELLARSYQKETYVLIDARTHRTVGQISPSGLDMY